MAEETRIEWADHTFNPWIGCTKVSPACDNCYAEAQASRYWPGEQLWAGNRKRTSENNWRQPLKWNRQAAEFRAKHGRPPMVFCASLADVFDNQVPEQWRRDLWALIYETPNLIWLLLTKRPQNIRKMLPANYLGLTDRGWPAMPNVWLGATVENQAEADRRIPHLLAAPAAKRFLSCEPLLGRVDLRWIAQLDDRRDGVIDALAGRDWIFGDDVEVTPPFVRYSKDNPVTRTFVGPKRVSIDWVIAGGESGREARPSHPDWFRSLRDQCAAAGVPFLFKQQGEWLPVGQTLPGYGKVHGATAVHPGMFKLHYGGARNKAPKHAFAERGVPIASLDDGALLTFRVGKKAAGQLLDGVLHDARPEAF